MARRLSIFGRRHDKFPCRGWFKWAGIGSWIAFESRRSCSNEVLERDGGGDPDGQQICVSLRGDVVQIRTSRGTQRTTQGRRFWGSRCESTGLRDVCDGCPSLERVGRTRIPLSARRLGERVIEFYRPTSSRKPLRGAPQVQSGKLRVLFADEEISLASQQPVQSSISLYALKGLHLLLLVPGYGT